MKPCDDCPKFDQYDPGSTYDEPDGYVPSGERKPVECGNWLCNNGSCPHEKLIEELYPTDPESLKPVKG